MKKDVTMKKSNFVKGAFITTIGIIISKILGILYVVPFHAVIGEKGGALYGYAYTIYTIFMSIATAGIPLAISKIVSEYQTLGYYNAKKKVFQLGKKVSFLLGFICFVIIFLFAPVLAKAVLGDVTGGNTIEDVTFVIRVIGTAILIVPTLSIYRGFFEGHRFMGPPSISQVLEQLVRVIIIIFGSFMALKVFGLSLANSVGIALFGATAGAFVSYFYLVEKKWKNKSKFNEKIRPVNEPFISDKVIFKKILIYSVPFIMIDIFKSFYNAIDMVTVVKGLVRYASFSTGDAETIYAMLSTWSNKFNMIVLAISTGVIVSLIPNLTESIVRNDSNEIQKKITQALSILLYITIPLTLGISFLAKPIWMLFYGPSVYGSSVLSYYIFAGFFIGLFTATVTIIQTMKDYKAVFISLLIGVIFKAIFNNRLMLAFYQMGGPSYYGVITASIIGYLLSFIYSIIILHVRYHISFETVIKNFIDILCGSVLMILALTIIKLVIPITSPSRIMNFIFILFYGVVGMIVYFVYAHYNHLTIKVFGKNLFQTIQKIILRK